MNKHAVEEMLHEMAGHLQAALTAVEAAVLTGTFEPLDTATAALVASWTTLTATLAPELAGDGREAPDA